MEDYSNYTATELALDEGFVKWVKYPGQLPDAELFWLRWLEEHPEKKEVVEEAKHLILAVLSEMEVDDIDSRQQAVWSKLSKSIGQKPDQNKSASPKLVDYSFLRIAAAILLIVSVGFVVWFSIKPSEENNHPLVSAESLFIKEINNGSQPKRLVLSDGSSIVLKPKSSIQYPEVFAKDLREIRLVGEAFFDVAKDPSKPFMVYSDQLVTKVTGTSFTIRAFQGENNSVQVKTGTVSVFPKIEKGTKTKNNRSREGVVLKPNQKVIFERESARLIKSLVDNPELINPSAKLSFEFKDAPLKQVFLELEKAYGIEIIYDEALSTCALNASLQNVPLYDKLRLICKGVNAHYEVLDSNIVVTGSGCK